MKILGIDPGLERVGYGLIEQVGSRLTPLDYGLIMTPRIDLPDRLRLIHEQVEALVEAGHPDLIATERLLFAVNKRTAMEVAKALGVVLLVAAERGVPWMELTPPEVKLGVVGNGAADKRQVQFMVVKLLALTETPRPDDVADALAVAIASALRGRLPRG
ncbi:MAG TPA: crossover junction endodeoxyribonuclease RuvC [Fimbriimonadaceae bacterium]|nr:crossover junction endodeoxyribonuclease RuvC [Fimbriimonadaceae bacterium]HRJ95282.1 crossover junction endodeoxyribonuclease RuvC [Fimbriimonadaceae bacterium]